MLSELPDLLRRAVGDHPDLSGGLDHQVLLVDEYQDLNVCDIELLQRLAQRGCSVLAAGDDQPVDLLVPQGRSRGHPPIHDRLCPPASVPLLPHPALREAASCSGRAS